MKIEYFQTIRKRDFAEILENFLTARRSRLPACRKSSIKHPGGGLFNLAKAMVYQLSKRDRSLVM